MGSTHPAHVGIQRRRLQNGSSRPQSVLRLCEAAESSGARSSRLSMLSTRKVMVKDSTHLVRVRVRVKGEW